MKNLYLIIIILFASGCNNDNQKDELVDTKTHQQNEMLTKIKSLETGVINGNLTNVKIAKSAKQLDLSYREFISKFPNYNKDSTAQMVLKCARINEGLAATFPAEKNMRFEIAKKFYEKAYTDFSDKINGGEMIYSKALILDMDQDSLEVAKKYYKKVVNEFAGSLYAEQAALRLKTINLTKEELVELFEKNANTLK